MNFKKFGDWGAFLGALFAAITNVAGIRTAAFKGLKAVWRGADHSQESIRAWLGAHLARPVMKIVAVSTIVALLLAGATLATAKSGSSVLVYAMMADAVFALVGMFALRHFMVKESNQPNRPKRLNQPQRVPYVAVTVGHAIAQLEPLVYISVDRFACVPTITEQYEQVPKPSIMIFKYKHLKG